MIDHLDTALENWLTARIDGVKVDFVTTVGAAVESADRPGAARKPSGTDGAIAVVLLSVTERSDRRDTDVTDVRDADGRVVARQPSMRFFDVDYGIVATGDPRAGHAVLGRLVQALVDDDVIDPEFVPPSLRSLGVPVELSMCADHASRELLVRRSAVAGVVVRVVVAFEPAADAQISAPAIELHLDMAPPPDPARSRFGHLGAGRSDPADVLGERVWTTVRRRELIARPAVDSVATPAVASTDDPAGSPERPAGRKGRR